MRGTHTSVCSHGPGVDEVGSWTEPYWFCDQYTNDTVQSPSMQQNPCSLHGLPRNTDAVYSWPSCGGGCVQGDACLACFEKCGTWGVKGTWDACDCPDSCYPEGLIADQTIKVLHEKAAELKAWQEAVTASSATASAAVPATTSAAGDAAAGDAAASAASSSLVPPPTPFFHAMGLKRPHLSYRAPQRFFDMYVML